MFDLRDEGLTRVNTNATPVDRMPQASPPTVETPTTNTDLDSDKKHELHRLLLSYYRQELDRQSENRFQMAIDADYYDSIQWSETEAAALKDRGQAPIVYNVIAQTVNWVLGTEKRGRSDFKILPRRKDEAKGAELKTDLLKYLSDVNRLPFSRSRAFEDAIKVGIGWLEDGAQDEDDGERDGDDDGELLGAVEGAGAGSGAAGASGAAESSTRTCGRPSIRWLRRTAARRNSRPGQAVSGAWTRSAMTRYPT